MRITRPTLLLACVLLGATHLVGAGQAKYSARVNTVQPAALAKARTYQWTTSLPAFDKKADGLIVAAVDRQLSMRGLTKVASGGSDLVITYASATRTDVDVKAKPSQSGSLPEFSVGMLMVEMREAAKNQTLFRARVNAPIEAAPAALEATINAAVAALFEKYPTPSKK